MAINIIADKISALNIKALNIFCDRYYLQYYFAKNIIFFRNHIKANCSQKTSLIRIRLNV